MTILHIGFRKCASTAIQRRLRETATELKTLHGLSYLPFVSRAGRVRFEQDLVSQRPSTASREIIEQVEDALANGMTPILSNDMFEALTPSSIAQLKRILPSISRVVAVIRDPRDLMPSIYGYRTQRGVNRKDFDRFYRKHLAREPLRGRFFDTLEPWAEVFGWDAINVHFMGAGSTDVVQRVLADVLSAPAGELWLSPSEEHRANITLGWRALEVLRDAFTQFRAAHDVEKVVALRAVVSGLSPDQVTVLAGKGRYLSADQIEELTDVFIDQARRLNEAKGREIVTAQDLAAPGPQARTHLPSLDQVSATDVRAIREMFGLS